MTVVWRFQINRELERDDALDLPAGRLGRRMFRNRTRLRMMSWFIAAFVLGLLGFWFVPLILQAAIPVGVSGTGVFLFAFWVFINVHHYFIDNVIWRSENPEVKKYLFGQPRSNNAAQRV